MDYSCFYWRNHKIAQERKANASQSLNEGVFKFKGFFNVLFYFFILERKKGFNFLMHKTAKVSYPFLLFHCCSTTRWHRKLKAIKLRQRKLLTVCMQANEPRNQLNANWQWTNTAFMNGQSCQFGWANSSLQSKVLLDVLLDLELLCFFFKFLFCRWAVCCLHFLWQRQKVRACIFIYFQVFSFVVLCWLIYSSLSHSLFMQL